MIVKTLFLYPPAGHVITGNLNVIPGPRVRNIISEGPKYRFPSNIDFPNREIAASVKDFSNHWCKRKIVEPDVLQLLKNMLSSTVKRYEISRGIYFGLLKIQVKL